MKRLVLNLCGVGLVAFGIALGVIGFRSALAGGEGSDSFLRMLAPISSGSVLLGLIRLVGFCALSVFCVLVGVGLCSNYFGLRKR